MSFQRIDLLDYIAEVECRMGMNAKKSFVVHVNAPRFTIESVELKDETIELNSYCGMVRGTEFAFRYEEDHITMIVHSTKLSQQVFIKHIWLVIPSIFGLSYQVNHEVIQSEPRGDPKWITK